MTMRAVMTKAVKDVTRRKGRTLLVVLGIFIGVFGLTAINFTEATLIEAFAYNAGANSAQPDISLGVDRLDPAVLPQLQATANVQVVQYSTAYLTQWHGVTAANAIPLAILSYPDPRHIALGGFQLTSGRYPGVGEIVMLDGDQALQPFTIGDGITVDGSDGPLQLSVVGLGRQPGQNPSASRSAIGFMSDAGLQQVAGALYSAGCPAACGDKSPLRRTIAVKLADANQARATASALEAILQAGGVTILNQSFPNNPTDAAQLARTIDGVFTLLRILAVLAVVMSGLLLLNTVTTLISEQTAIIGTMKAIGGARGAILRGYLSSVAIYSLLGTLPGLALGILAGDQLANYLAPQIPLALGPFTIAPWIVAVSLAVGFGVPLVAALLPLWNGTRISVRDALAAYGVSAGKGSGVLARLGQGMRWIPQTTWLGLRGLFRRRARAALTLLTLAAAGTCFLVVQTAVTSVDDTVATVNANLDSDMRAFFRDPAAYAKIERQLLALPGVARIERDGADNATTPWGTIGVQGYEPDTQLYHPRLTSGRWLQPGDTNVVLLSDDAVRRTGLHIGDTLTIQGNYGSITRQLSLTVIGTLDQSISDLGWIGAAVMPVDTLYELRGLPADQAATSTLEVQILSKDRSQVAVDALAAQVNAIVNPAGSSADGHGYFSGDVGTVDTTREYVTRRQGDWYILYYMLYAIALIVGVAGVLGLANALAASVLERRREIGMLRAMGAAGRRVARVFWVEGLALGGLSWLAGALLGLPLAYAFVQVLWQVVMPVHFFVDAVAFAVMLAAVLAIATLASIAPALRASRMRLAEILRYE
jgi:ABC-type antimicrobial peptide transport system permease subunit